jgi:uncharacterized membrane protein
MQQTLSSYPDASHTPKVAGVPLGRPLAWLAMGWRDFARHPGTSLGHGFLLAAFGWLLLIFCSLHIDLFATVVTAFMLLAPVFAAGLYETARLTEAGYPVRFDASLQGALRHGRRLVSLGLVLAALTVAWAICSRALFAAAYGGAPPSMFVDINRTLLEWHYPGFFTSYVATGAAFAALAFVVSVTAAPMIFDRGTDLWTATSTSVRAVLRNPLPMLVWAASIVMLTAIGFVLALFGLAVVFPVLGFATWHAYRELLPDE